ncbi:MAG: family 1 encapsulin nanocompartment shell protein [Terracidiphilus sp.]
MGVNGPYSVLLGADEYTAVAETSDHGYPVLEHVKRLVDGQILWAPAIAGAFVLTTRGGDFELHIGQDVSHRLSEPTQMRPSGCICRRPFTFCSSPRKPRWRLRLPRRQRRREAIPGFLISCKQGSFVTLSDIEVWSHP